MFSVGVPELLVLGLVLVAVVWLLARGAASEPVPVRREWRLVRLCRAVGVLAGAYAAGSVAYGVGSWGLGVMLAPAVFGLVVLLATALGETLARPRRAPGPRTASLQPRRVVDYLPRGLGPVTGVLVVATTALLVTTTATASRDGHTGEVRALRCEAGAVAGSATPYPGSYYSLPLLALLAGVVVVAVVAAHLVVRRPRGLTVLDEDDDVLRRRGVRVVVAATGLAFAVTYAGTALATSTAMHALATGEPSCAAGWVGPAATALLGSALLAGGVALGCLLQLVPRLRTTSVADARR